MNEIKYARRGTDKVTKREHERKMGCVYKFRYGVLLYSGFFSLIECFQIILFSLIFCIAKFSVVFIHCVYCCILWCFLSFSLSQNSPLFSLIFHMAIFIAFYFSFSILLNLLLLQIFECKRMKFSEIPSKLQPLLMPPDPIIIHHVVT